MGDGVAFRGLSPPVGWREPREVEEEEEEEKEEEEEEEEVEVGKEEGLVEGVGEEVVGEHVVEEEEEEEVPPPSSLFLTLRRWAW